VSNTHNKGIAAVYSWGHHWFERVITGRKNVRLEEVMKINESSDTQIVGMHLAKRQNERVLKGKLENRAMRGQCIESNCGETAWWCGRHVTVAVGGRCEGRK
jgi:hypothetical protein